MATEQEIQFQRVLNDLIKDQRDLISEINSELKNELNVSKEVRKQYDVLENISDKLVNNAEDALELSQKQLDKEKSKVNSVVKQLSNAYGILQTRIKEGKKLEELTVQEKALLAAGQEGFEVEKATVALIERKINYQKNLNASIGLTGTLLKSATKITEKLGLSGLDDVFKKAKDAAVDKAKALGVSDEKALGLSGKIKTMSAGLGVLASGIGKKLTDPLVLLTAQIGLIKKFFDLYGGVNKRIVDQGKQLNISKEQSQALYESAYQYAAEQRNAFVTEARILEGRHKLNEALGTSIAFTNKEAITAEKLSHYYGISEEQNAHLAVLGREIGQTNDDILNTVIKTTVSQKAQFGGTISQQKVLQKVSSVSGDILTKFKGNVSELAKAVLQADRLGLTLEQVDKIGESLLNFEQSIEAELKAELLTGKAINLEKARSAALSGDTAKLTTAIAEEVGNIHKFERMNVLQRQAYAEAFGMSASEMGDMLRKREFENKLGADATKSAAEQLRLAKERGITVEESVRKDLEAKSLAELQKYTFEKISSILSRIASGPMATIYKYIEKGLKGVEGILGGFSKMTGGGLGNALGAAILGAPLLLATTRLMAGGLRGLLFQRGTDANPMVTRPTLAGGMGGGMGGLFGGKTTLASGAYVQGGQAFSAAGKPLTGAAANSVITAAGKQGRGFGAFSPKSMGAGLGLGVGGMALSGIASSMEPGAGANTVGVLGQTAQYAGMGMMFGPWGAAIGGLVGLGMGLFNLSKENEERRKQEADTNKETQKKTNDLIEQLSSRPVKLTINNEDLGRINTNTSMFSGNSKLATS
jgi:hypothetical protein